MNIDTSQESIEMQIICKVCEFEFSLHSIARI